MAHRISEATRYTVYYTREKGSPEEHFACRAADRGGAMQELSKFLKTKDFTVTRVLPGWPKGVQAPTA